MNYAFSAAYRPAVCRWEDATLIFYEGRDTPQAIIYY
jgi:hypothetical protein